MPGFGILLVFCLLIAMATFLKAEHDKRNEVQEGLRREQLAGAADHQFVEAIKNDARLSELLNGAVGKNDPGAVDKFWRDLVEGRAVVAAAKDVGLSTAELRERVGDLQALKAKGIDPDKAIRNAAVTAGVDRAMAGSGPATPEQIAGIIERGLSSQVTGGHKWPPIITLNDANGQFFKSGSAELNPGFHKILLETTSLRIAELIKEFDVDVIEVVGHTDEQAIGIRQSNLDRDLLPVLKNASAVGSIVPADNAGLGLARAVSVVSVLRQSRALSAYKLLPLSGGQLINTDETLAIAGTGGDDRARRRIEIRLRKAVPHDSSVTSAIPGLTLAPLPEPRPAARRVMPLSPAHSLPSAPTPPRPAFKPLDITRPR